MFYVFFGAEIHFSPNFRPAFLILQLFFHGSICKDSGFSSSLPFVVCSLGPAVGSGRMDPGEKVVSIAEDDGSGSGSGTTLSVTGEDAASGVEDATVATVGVGAVLHASAFTAAAVEDGTSGVTAASGRSVTRDGE